VRTPRALRVAGPAQRANRRFESGGPERHKRKTRPVAGSVVNWWAVKGEYGRLASRRLASVRTPRALRVAGPAQRANRRFESGVLE
jgi:hypothetical protein